jgi:hypothetical protein
MKKEIIYKSACIALFIMLSNTAIKAQLIEESNIKTNVIAIANPIEKLQNLEPIYFNYNVKEYSKLKLPKTLQYGFKIKGVEESFPSLITTNTKTHSAGKNQYKNASFKDVNTDDLIPVLVAAINEQQQAIELLKKELAELKNK